MGRKYKQKISFVVAVVLILNLCINLISPQSSYADEEINVNEYKQTFLVNDKEINTASTVKLSPGDNIEYRLDFKVNNKEPLLKEGDKVIFDLPDIFSNIKLNYAYIHFKNIHQDKNQIILVCDSDRGGYITVNATVGQVEKKISSQIVTNIANQKSSINTIVTPANIVDKLIDKIVNSSSELLGNVFESNIDIDTVEAQTKEEQISEEVDESLSQNDANTEESVKDSNDKLRTSSNNNEESNEESNEETTEDNNEKIEGSIEIINKDKDDDTLLENSEFTIKNKDGKTIITGKTDEDGIVLFENLESGKYTYQQIAPPDGYDLNDEEYSFEISENGQVVKVEVTNEKSSTKVTATTESSSGTKDTSTSSSSETVATGDSGIMMYVAALAVAIVVAICVNRKRKAK